MKILRYEVVGTPRGCADEIRVQFSNKRDAIQRAKWIATRPGARMKAVAVVHLASGASVFSWKKEAAHA